MNKKEIRLESDNTLSLLIRLSIPGIISMFVQALYNIVDSIYIGHVSKEALTALSLAFPIQIILIAIAVGTGIGVTSLISRRIGEEKISNASNVAEHGLFISIIYGIIGCVVGLWFAEEILSFFTNDPLLIQLGSQYIRVILIGTTALSIPIISNNILRGEGNTVAPMIAMLIGSVLNMVLDPFIIFGLWIFPRLEIEGAAIATVFSRIMSGAFVLFILFKGDNLLKPKLRDFKPDFSIAKEIYRVGLPSMIMQFLSSIMIGTMNIILATYSTVAIAVMGVYFRLQSFVFMPVFGLTQGYMPIIGYNYGHKKPKRIKQTSTYGFTIAFAFTLIGFIIFQLFPKKLIVLFNDSPEMVAIGTHALQAISYLYLVVGFSIIASVTFQAFGMGFRSLLISLLRQIVLLLPLAYVLGEVGGLDLVWYAFPIAEGIAFCVIILWFRSTLQKILQQFQ